MAYEGMAFRSIPIPLVDDGIDEDKDEIFLAHLELLDAVNKHLISIGRASSNCIIVDDECKLSNIVQFTALC